MLRRQRRIPWNLRFRSGGSALDECLSVRDVLGLTDPRDEWLHPDPTESNHQPSIHGWDDWAGVWGDVIDSYLLTGSTTAVFDPPDFASLLESPVVRRMFTQAYPDARQRHRRTVPVRTSNAPTPERPLDPVFAGLKERARDLTSFELDVRIVYPQVMTVRRCGSRILLGSGWLSQPAALEDLLCDVLSEPKA